MSNTFDIPTGQLRIDGSLVALGYSGHGPAANDASRVAERNVGPLPPNAYRMREWTASEVAAGHKGPCVFELTPIGTGDMHNRSAFLIHWDNALLNFTGSDGCIVFWSWAPFLALRKAIAAGSNVLTVTTPVAISVTVDNVG